MADELSVDLEIGGDEALADFKRKLSTGLDDVKIGTGFTKELQGQFDTAQRKALSLQGSLKSLAALDPKGKGLDWISKQAQSSQKEIAGINQKLQTIQKLASQTSSKSLLKIYEDDAKSLEKELDKAEKKMLRLQQARFNKPAPVSGGSGGSGGLDLADLAGNYVAPAAILAGAYKLGTDVDAAAKKAEGSTTQLASAAKQTGVAFDDLNKKSEAFARLTGQGAASAASSFASIAEFSKQAGRSDQIEKLSNGLADLFAAKNIPVDKINDYVSQLKTGQDEVFDRLAGANPSKFYDEYAKSIGKTAEQLTDAEKSQVRFDAVVKLSTIFSGEAEKKLDSLTGKSNTLAASIENLYTRAGKAATPFIKGLVDNANTFIDFTQGKGLFASPEEKARIKAEAQKAADERVKIFVETNRETQRKIEKAADKPFASLESLALSKIDATEYFLAQSARIITEVRADGSKLERYENTGEIQARLDALKDAATKKAQAEADLYLKSFQAVLADKGASVSLLQLTQKEFQKVQSIFPEETRAKIRQDLAQAISSGVAKGFEDTLADPNQTADKLVSQYRKLQAGVAGLLPETSKKLLQDFEKAIQSMSSKALSLRDSIKDALVAGTENNQLLRLMVDLESATDRAEKKFGQFGAGVVKMMADLDRAALSSQINKILFEGSKKALDFEQQARRLEQTPRSGLDQFGRRIDNVSAEADFRQTQAQLQRQAAEAQFYAKIYNPNNPKSFDQYQNGSNRSEFFGSAKTVLDEIKALRQTDLQGTGAAGAGLLADRIQKAITIPTEQLLAALQSGGADAFAAQQILDEKARSASDQLAAEQTKFQDRLEQERFKDLALKDAQEKIQNLQLNGKNLPDAQKLQEFLAITQELGTENLTADLRSARIEALKASASLTRAEAKAAADQAKEISETMTEITRQLKAKGLKVDLAETPVVDIEVRDGTLSATQRSLGTRASGSDTKRLTQ